tara:strand:- start:1038 stop:1676 length:639 start_codon:yes stop_codon:yes gene_type:complete
MNNGRFIDISVELSDHLPTWPGSHGISISPLQVIDDFNPANVSRLDIDVHSGTHIDAPLHFVKNGKSTNEIDLDRLIGDCFVAEMPSHITTIKFEDLEMIGIPDGTKRLLLKTCNSGNNLWDNNEFNEDFCALDKGAANWVVNNGIDLIGIDYCSIQKFNDSVESHQILLNQEVLILEGLDLRNVISGRYNLICLPISVKGIEGVPVRAILQ